MFTMLTLGYTIIIEIITVQKVNSRNEFQNGLIRKFKNNCHFQYFTNKPCIA